MQQNRAFLLCSLLDRLDLLQSIGQLKTLRQKLPSDGKVDITIYECTCNVLICGCFLLKFQQNTRWEMRNPIKVELIFCFVAFKHCTDFCGDR